MKTIGLIGGMSWESSKVYYELINQLVKEQLGGFHSADCLLYSVDFAKVEALQHAGHWAELDAMMANAARRLEHGGAQLIVLCTNTMHRCRAAIEGATTLPFLHIASATGAAIEAQELTKVGLLGTRFTMEQDFFKEVLLEEFAIGTVIPNEADRATVHRIIYEELVQGVIREDSRRAYQEVIGHLADQGAQGVILGCTEIPLLISAADVNIPVFDTTSLHAQAAVQWALAKT